MTSVKPFGLKGRRGTVITLSLQFRSQVADPTVKFQKFLRPSERLLGISVDSPVIHKSSITKTKCFYPCRGHGQNVCTGWPYYLHSGYDNNLFTGYQSNVYHNNVYPNTGYQNNGYQSCPTTCTQYSYTCPTYCPQSCCSQVHHGQSLPSAKPTKTPTPAVTLATALVYTVTSPPVTKTSVPITQASVKYVQPTEYTSNQLYDQCNTCHLYSSPYCYTYCDESCCKHGHKEDYSETLAEMRENLRRFREIMKLGKDSDLPGFSETEFAGNEVPVLGERATLAVKTLQRNIEKLEAKIKRGEKQFFNNSRTGKEGKSLKTKDSNVLPYFEDELSDISNDFDLSEKNVEYPHMNVQPGDKDTEQLDDDSKFKDSEESASHPDNPVDNSKELTPENVDNHPQMHLDFEDKQNKNDFKLDEDSERDQDSPPDNYGNSKDFTTRISTAYVYNYKQTNNIHPYDDKDSTRNFKLYKGSARDPDSPTDKYENSK